MRPLRKQHKDGAERERGNYAISNRLIGKTGEGKELRQKSFSVESKEQLRSGAACAAMTERGEKKRLGKRIQREAIGAVGGWGI